MNNVNVNGNLPSVLSCLPYEAVYKFEPTFSSANKFLLSRYSVLVCVSYWRITREIMNRLYNENKL